MESSMSGVDSFVTHQYAARRGPTAKTADRQQPARPRMPRLAAICARPVKNSDPPQPPFTLAGACPICRRHETRCVGNAQLASRISAARLRCYVGFLSQRALTGFVLIVLSPQLREIHFLIPICLYGAARRFRLSLSHAPIRAPVSGH